MNKEMLQKFDSKNVLGSISYFPKQCANAWAHGSYVSKDVSIKNVLVLGMGGSALGAYVLDSLRILTVPMIISHEYTIPPWVNEETLVLAISYSGTTEETLSATDKALTQNAHVVGITAGGTLEKTLKEKGVQVCIINREDNPCDQPRYAVGAMMLNMLKIFTAHNLCTLKSNHIEDALVELENWQKNFIGSNKIEEIYEETKDLKNKMPVLIHAEHLANLGHFVRNQIHETGKAFAVIHEIPELNHHLMEGLAYPLDNTKNLRVLFFESNLYSDKIKKRFEVTKDVLAKQNINYKSIMIDGTTALAQALIGMLRGQYVAFSLALIHEKDPSEIPWVNYFKKQLG